MITERQINILRAIIATYLKEAQPIASGLLVDKFKGKISSATIRNEMVVLEKEGFIEQPHTSAGRVPTEKAYNFYVENLLDCSDKKKLLNIGQFFSNDEVKGLARDISFLTGDAVIIAFAKNDFYYTGLSNLFAKEEFADRNMLISVSQIIDHLDRVVEEIFDNSKDIEILVGSKNPFGNKCSAVIGVFKYKRKKHLLVVLGPIRLDYQKAYTLVQEVVENIK